MLPNSAKVKDSYLKIALAVLRYAAFIFACVVNAEAQTVGIEHFYPFPGDTTEIWRLTSDSNFRHWINYHNTDAWSPDGRYIAIEESVPHSYQNSGGAWIADPSTKQIYFYDLLGQELIHVGSGQGPRWANQSNSLFFIEFDPLAPTTEAKVIRYDVNSHAKTILASGIVRLDGIDRSDEWLYGLAALTGEIFRLQNLSGGVRQNITGEIPVHRIIVPNPAHPVIFYRDDQRDRHGLMPFGGTRYLADLDGRNVRMTSPNLQRGHTAWSGDGTYLLTGGQSVMGRKWNEPYPSNMHILAWGNFGKVFGCGRDGRWVTSSRNVGSLGMADLRSGDVRIFLRNAGSFLHRSTLADYGQGSFLYDNEAKCSPDGTKVVFASNYDIENGPVARVRGHIPGSDSLTVDSTHGFPEQGRLSIGREIVGYTMKTASGFGGISRNLYRTTSVNLSGLTPEMIEAFPERTSDKEFRQEYKLKHEQIEQLKVVTGEVPSGLSGIVTSFDLRVIPEQQRGTPPARFVDPEFPEPDSPLVWQKQTDVYVAVVRQPDSPYLRMSGDRLELIPGEDHEEIRGYYLLRGGVRFTDDLLQPGATIALEEPGVLSAAAIEWSGLASAPSQTVSIQGGLMLHVLEQAPADFAWTQERWLLNGEPATAEEAQNAVASVREIVHLYDGVICREYYESGEMIQGDDLNEDGRPVRRQVYQSNQLVRREYHGRGRLETTELFNDQGHIVEVIRHGSGGTELSRTSFQGAEPVNHVGRSFMQYAPDGPGRYQKSGSNWVKTKDY